MTERIERAAINYDDVGVVSLPKPARHHHIIGARYGVDKTVTGGPDRAVQGFITSEGRFVDRVEGLRIARAAKQVVRKQGNPHMLFSEDMW